MNIDENTMNNIKNMVDNGNIQDAISQISPEMLQISHRCYQIKTIVRIIKITHKTLVKTI